MKANPYDEIEKVIDTESDFQVYMNEEGDKLTELDPSTRGFDDVELLMEHCDGACVIKEKKSQHYLVCSSIEGYIGLRLHERNTAGILGGYSGFDSKFVSLVEVYSRMFCDKYSGVKIPEYSEGEFGVIANACSAKVFDLFEELHLAVAYCGEYLIHNSKYSSWSSQQESNGRVVPFLVGNDVEPLMLPFKIIKAFDKIYSEDFLWYVIQ